MKGLIHRESLRNTNVNQAVFISILQRLRRSIRIKGPKIFRNWWLHMDNALVHMGGNTVNYLLLSGTQVLKHPPPLFAGLGSQWLLVFSAAEKTTQGSQICISGWAGTSCGRCYLFHPITWLQTVHDCDMAQMVGAVCGRSGSLLWRTDIAQRRVTGGPTKLTLCLSFVQHVPVLTVYLFVVVLLVKLRNCWSNNWVKYWLTRLSPTCWKSEHSARSAGTLICHTTPAPPGGADLTCHFKIFLIYLIINNKY